jgi:hypothetical protein
MEYDDPSYLPKWGIDVLMPSIMKFSNLTLGASLSPHFRVNKNLMIKGRFGMPFTEDLDGNLEKPKDRFTRKNLARDMNLMAHYKLISSNSTKKRKVQLEANPLGTGNVITHYTGKIDRTIEKSLCFSGGIGAFNYNTEMRLKSNEESNPSKDTTYILRDFSSRSLNLGFSFYRVESFGFKGDRSITYWNTTRFYGLVTIGLSHNFAVDRVTNEKLGYAGRITENNIKSGFDNPIYSNNLGYRIGLEKNFEIMNSNASYVLGFEYGSIPRLSHPSQASVITSSRFIMFNLGVGFGAKPKKLK